MSEEKSGLATCYIFSGIGNQLFQIATTLAFAKEHGLQAVFPENNLNSGRGTYWDTCFPQLTVLPGQHPFNPHRRDSAYHVVRETIYPRIGYHPLPTRSQLPFGNYCLHGYFQSDKYWGGYLDLQDIRCLFQIAPEDQSRLIQKMTELRDLPGGECLIGVHVRRTDYLVDANHMTLPQSYYENAVAQFDRVPKDSRRFVVFSDDVRWCEQSGFLSLFEPNVSVVQEGELPDYLQLLAMANMDHMIVANSTFSWWGAVLGGGPHSGKTVVCPREWFPASTQLDPSELFHPGWSII